MLRMAQETEKISHTLLKDPNLGSKIEKILKKSESGAFFQILMHNNFQQTNIIPLESFTQTLCWEDYKKKRIK